MDFDNPTKLFMFSFLLIIIFLFIVLLAFVIYNGIKGFNVISFNTKWNPSQKYGILSFLFSSLMIVIISICISTPLSVCYALWANFIIFKSFRKIALSTVKILSCIPSVVYGFVGYYILIVHFKMNFSIITGTIILTIMIIPILILFLNIQYSSQNKSLFYASVALGATKIETIYNVYFKNKKIIILNAILLGITRVMGETIASTMLLGGGLNSKFSLNSSSASLTTIIAAEFQEANGHWRSALFSIGLVILCIVIIINFLFIIVKSKKSN